MSVMVQIPVFIDTPHWSERIALGSSVYILTFNYNARMDRWILDIADANNNALATGLPVLCMADALQNLGAKTPGMPPGVLFALDITGAGADPNATNFGQSVLLFYFEP